VSDWHSLSDSLNGVAFCDCDADSDDVSEADWLELWDWLGDDDNELVEVTEDELSTEET